MTSVPYHAWTHRPKSQGGTDPIEIEIPSAAVEFDWIRVTQPYGQHITIPNDNDIAMVWDTQEGSINFPPFSFPNANGPEGESQGFYAHSFEFLWEDTFDGDVIVLLSDELAFPTSIPMGQFKASGNLPTSATGGFWFGRWEANTQWSVTLYQNSGSDQFLDAAYWEIVYLGPGMSGIGIPRGQGDPDQ